MQNGGALLQYTIEARELTSENTHSMAYDAAPRSTVIDAADPDEAITQYVQQSAAELVSFTSPGRGESIATVKKEDQVFLVRVYAA